MIGMTFEIKNFPQEWQKLVDFRKLLSDFTKPLDESGKAFLGEMKDRYEARDNWRGHASYTKYLRDHELRTYSLPSENPGLMVWTGRLKRAATEKDAQFQKYKLTQSGNEGTLNIAIQPISYGKFGKKSVAVIHQGPWVSSWQGRTVKARPVWEVTDRFLKTMIAKFLYHIDDSLALAVK